MSAQVFISYASADQPLAESIREHLEGAGITCWVAHRDVPPGSSYHRAIPPAIRAARVLVLVFSRHAVASEHVERELEIGATNSGTLVLPVRVDAVLPEGGFEYFLRSCQWIDASGRPSKDWLDFLLEVIRAHLAGEPPPPQPKATSGVGRRRHGLALAMVALAALLGGTALWLFRPWRPPIPESETLPASKEEAGGDKESGRTHVALPRLTSAQRHAIGEQVTSRLISALNGQDVEDEVSTYLSGVSERVLRTVPAPESAVWRVRAVHSARPFLGAMPDGTILVTSAVLTELIRSEAQLAGLLALEALSTGPSVDLLSLEERLREDFISTPPERAVSSSALAEELVLQAALDVYGILGVANELPRHPVVSVEDVLPEVVEIMRRLGYPRAELAMLLDLLSQEGWLGPSATYRLADVSATTASLALKEGADDQKVNKDQYFLTVICRLDPSRCPEQGDEKAQAGPPEPEPTLEERLQALFASPQAPSREEVREILNEADVSTLLPDGWPLLHKAILNSWQPVVEELLERGADPALTLSAGTGYPGMNALHLAVRERGVPLVRLLLATESRDILCRTADASGRLPIHFAAADGSVELVRLLIEAGTPLMAQTPEHSFVWDLLADAGTSQAKDAGKALFEKALAETLQRKDQDDLALLLESTFLRCDHLNLGRLLQAMATAPPVFRKLREAAQRLGCRDVPSDLEAACWSGNWEYASQLYPPEAEGRLLADAESARGPDGSPFTAWLETLDSPPQAVTFRDRLRAARLHPFWRQLDLPGRRFTLTAREGGALPGQPWIISFNKQGECRLQSTAVTQYITGIPYRFDPDTGDLEIQTPASEKPAFWPLGATAIHGQVRPPVTGGGFLWDAEAADWKRLLSFE